jgi:hypothetical protein
MDRDAIELGETIQELDPNVQRLLIDAAQRWVSQKEAAPPRSVAPEDGGRQGDEQYPAPVDAINLLDTTTNDTVTVYDIEVSYGGDLDPVSVTVTNDGTVSVQAAD